MKESSAARNGMLTEHAVLEIDGQNVVGMKDKDIAKVIEDTPTTVTVTIMPGSLLRYSSSDFVEFSHRQIRS